MIEYEMMQETEARCCTTESNKEQTLMVMDMMMYKMKMIGEFDKMQVDMMMHTKMVLEVDIMLVDPNVSDDRLVECLK